MKMSMTAQKKVSVMYGEERGRFTSRGIKKDRVIIEHMGTK